MRLTWYALRVMSITLFHLDMNTLKGEHGRRVYITSKYGLMVNVYISIHLAYTDEAIYHKHL